MRAGLAWLLVLVVLLPEATANVVIQEVLYNPFGAESGGEAVQIRNTGSAPVDVSGWVLATETSQSDATLPENTVLFPDDSFLIADSGWDSAKDNPDWPKADYEETITLGNTNAGIALKNAQGEIVDAVGWGDLAEIKQGLFEGIPAKEAEEGESLKRTQDTNDNSEDFIAGTPSFAGQNSVELELIVGNNTARIVEDDDSAPGTQILPWAGRTRLITVQADDNAVVRFDNKVVENKKIEIPHTLSPGDYEVFVDDQPLSFTVLPLRAFKLITRKVSVKAAKGGQALGELLVKNEGNVNVDVEWKVSDLRHDNDKILAKHVSIPKTRVGVGEQAPVSVSVTVPSEARTGVYKAVLTAKIA